MSSQSNLVRSFSMCVKYLKGKKSSNLSRAISYCTPYHYWHIPRNAISNVKAMQKNALVSNDVPMRRYDDTYAGKLIGNKGRVPYEKTGRKTINRRSYDEDDMPDARSENEIRLGEQEQIVNAPAQKRGNNRDKFVSEYDDVGTTKQTKVKSDWDEQGNSNKNWRRWNNHPDRQSEEYGTVRNRQEQIDREQRLRTPRRIPHEELRLEWQSRKEPSRRIKRPPEATGTVYKFLKPLHNLQPVPPTTNPEELTSNKKSRNYDSKFRDKQRKALEQKYWHHWESCPEERTINMSSEKTHELKKHQRPQGVQRYGANKEQHSKRLVQPPKPYESLKRKYQTCVIQVPQMAPVPHALAEKTSFNMDLEGQDVCNIKPMRKSVAPPRYRLFIRPQVRRKQSGMEKLFQLAWDYSLSKNTEEDQCHKIAARSPTKNIDFAKKAVASYCDSSHSRSASLSNTTEDPNSPPICHFKDVAVIAPPKLPMCIRKYITKRCPAPVPCFSERIKVNPTKLSHSEYIGNLL